MRAVQPHTWTWMRATVQWSWGRWCWDSLAVQTKQSSSLTCRSTTRWPTSYKRTPTRSLHWWWVWKWGQTICSFFCLYVCFPFLIFMSFHRAVKLLNVNKDCVIRLLCGLIIVLFCSFALQGKESSSQLQFWPRMLGLSWALSTSRGMFSTYPCIHVVTHATIH